MKAGAAIAGYSRRAGLDPAIVGLVAFFAIHMLIRLFGTSNFSVDDTEAAVHVQAFQLYYSLRNPPLFDWLFYGLIQVTGLSVFTIQILKTALMTGAAVFFYLALRPGFRHRAALTAALASYGATAFYGWDIFQQFSHTVTLIFAMAFTFWALMRLVRAPQTIDYVFLGIGLGMGLLSKYLFALYFLALLVAAIRRPVYRPAILSARMGLTLVAGLVVVSPLLIGLWEARDALLGTLGGRVAGASSGPGLESFGFLILLTAEFWLPFAVILWIALARWPASAPAGETTAAVPEGEGDANLYPLLRDATAIMVAVIFFAFFFLGTKIEGGRYLVVMFSLLPAAVFAGLDRRPNFPRMAMERFFQGAIGFVVIIAVFRFATFLFLSPPFCLPRCVLFVDYTPVAAKIGTPDGKQNVILSNHVHIGSNLLRLVPNAKVVIDAYTAGSDLGIAPPAERNCYFVWFRNYRSADELPLETALRQALRRDPLPSELAAIGPIEFATVDWQTKILRSHGPDTVVGIARIDSAERICDGGRIPGLSPPPSNNSMQ
jgi:hypothetical protein